MHAVGSCNALLSERHKYLEAAARSPSKYKASGRNHVQTGRTERNDGRRDVRFLARGGCVAVTLATALNMVQAYLLDVLQVEHCERDRP